MVKRKFLWRHAWREYERTGEVGESLMSAWIPVTGPQAQVSDRDSDVSRT